MKTPVVVLFALTVSLAVGHIVEANNEPTPSVAKDLMRMLFGGAKRRAMASPHIAGGTEVQPHSHPYLVAVSNRVSEKLSEFCGGSLITPQWILTAAHCVTTQTNESVLVVTGAHNIQKLEPHHEVIAVKRVLKFDSWDEKNVTDDITLLELSKPAKLNDKVNLIRLPSLGLAEKNLWQTPVVMSGWGPSNDGDEVSVLRSATTSVLDNRICNLILGRGRVSDRQICSDGSEGVHACHGDSGGPLVMTESDGEPTVIGVASFGVKEGYGVGYPTVFTRVDQYLEWIANHTGIELRK